VSEKKKAKKKVVKDGQLIVRISKDDRDRFVALCEALDTSAAREVRRFIRDFVAQNDTSGG
jgi:hypothetical protein